MDVQRLQFEADEIQRRTQAIYHAMCERPGLVDAPNFRVISEDDLAALFDLYDRQFFDGQLRQTLADQSPQPLRFRVSSRMTRAGGKTIRRPARPGSRSGPFVYEIAVAARLLFMTSRGEAPTADDAGNAARQAARVLDQFGIDADWIHLTDPRESVLPDDFDAALTEGICE